MAVLVPEIEITNALEALLKWHYDDLTTRAGLGTVGFTSEDVDTGMTINISVAGALGVAQQVQITTVDGSALSGKSFKLGTPSTNYYIHFVTKESEAVLIDRQNPEIFNEYITITGTETDEEIKDLMITMLSSMERFTAVSTGTNTMTVTCVETNQEQKSLLFQLLGFNQHGNINYFNTMRDLIANRYSEESKRKFPIKMGFDFNENEMPMLNLVLPNEEPYLKQVGTEGGVHVRGDETQMPENAQGSMSMYNLVVSSNNMNEVVVIYTALKAIMLSGIDQFSLRGLIDIEFSGRDLTMDYELKPLAFHHRTIGMRFGYEQYAPSLKEYIKATAVEYQGTVIP